MPALRWLTAILLLLPALASASQRYTVDRWGVDEGLPNNALSGVTQSRDGYLWVATWAGTVRFDGIRFTPIAEDLPNDHHRTLLQDRDGFMWIGVAGAGLVRWHPDSTTLAAGRFDAFTTARGLAGYDVRALAEDADGRIWAATENGVSIVQAGHVTTLRTEQGLPRNAVTSVARARDGGMWIATTGGICHVSGPAARCDLPTGAPARAAAGLPSAILEDRRGRLWIATDKGLFVDGVSLSGRAVTGLFEAREGGVWVGFADASVAFVSDRAGEEADMLERYGPADGLPTGGPVVAFHEDPEGSIWIAVYNAGLARLRPKRVTMYSVADGLPAKVVGSIVQDAAGTIWAGSQCGPVSAFEDGRFVPRFVEYTKDACAWVVWPARDGALWIGTRGSGLFRWDQRRMERFGPENGLSDTRVSGLFEDRDGVVWIGTELGGLHTYAHGRLSRAYGPADGVATGYIASFAQDRAGRVWIGSNANGLSVYDSGRFRTLPPENSPPSRNIAGLLVDSRGDLWIGTAAAGLFRRRGERYEPFGVKEGLGDRLTAVMIEDRDATMWIGTARGISRLERAQIDAVADGRSATLDPIILDRGDGLLNVEGSGGGLDPSGLLDRDGRLWFSTIDGIAVIDPSSFRRNQVVPKVLIEGATLAGRPALPGDDGAIHVPAGTGAVEVAYTAFSLLAPHKVRFRYRLRGFETQWEDVGARRLAYYTRLPPATYTLEVVAANNDGLWSTTPASLRLVVAPFWWERRLAQGAGLGLLLALTGTGVWFVALRRARARVRELERAGALDRERSRIARDLHDDLGSRLSHIAMMADASASRDRDHPIARAARDAVQTMDELVWAVNARNDSVDGFASYATQFAEEHLQAAGLHCRVRIQPDLGARPLGADTRRHLYLACKEAVNNAVKHAQASEVRLSLSVDGDTLVLEIADNGRGLPLQGGDPTGNGLTNMRERMEAAGGTLDVDSAPGRGTRLVFRAPIG